MTNEQTVERVARCRVAKAIIADHLQLLNDFDIDADIYNSDPECIDGAYATADFILAAMQPALAEAEARGRGKGLREAAHECEQVTYSGKYPQDDLIELAGLRCRDAILALIDTEAPMPTLRELQAQAWSEGRMCGLNKPSAQNPYCNAKGDS